MFVYRSQDGKRCDSTPHQPRSSLAADHWDPSCCPAHRRHHRALVVPQPQTPECFASPTDDLSRPSHSWQGAQYARLHQPWPAKPETNGNGAPSSQRSTKDLYQGLHRHAHTHPHTLPCTHGGKSTPAFPLPVLTGYHQVTNAAASVLMS